MGREQVAKTAIKEQSAKTNNEKTEEEEIIPFDMKQDMINLMGTMLRSERLVTKNNSSQWYSIIRFIRMVRDTLVETKNDSGYDRRYYDLKDNLSWVRSQCKRYLESHSRIRFSIEGRRRKRYAEQLITYIGQYLSWWDIDKKENQGSGTTLGEQMGVDTSILYAKEGEV